MVKNKFRRGNEQTISVYWFVILGIVAVSVIVMVSSIFGSAYDVREIENEILINQIANCLSNGGRVTGNFLSLNNDNFSSTCKINFHSEEGEYYVSFEVFENWKDFNSKLDLDQNSAIKKIYSGNAEMFNTYCQNRDDKLNIDCSTKWFYTLDDKSNTSEEKPVMIKISVAINKFQENR